jgi:hypothetical protein
MRRVNLAICVVIFNYMVLCNNLVMFEPFDGSYFGHVLSKINSYITTYEKVVQGLKYVFIKSIEYNI